MKSKKDSHKAEIWDVYIRIFHWALTILVLTSFISIKYFDSLYVHFLSGYCIIGLLVFRITWGLFGSRTARFSNFIKGPKAIFRYFKSLSNRQEYKPSFGHSPIAALSVMAMLFILIAQVVSGLFFYDEEIFLEGPLAQYGSDAMTSNASYYHPIGANLVMIIIAAHLVAIAIYYIFFKENLVTPMITGWRKFYQQSELNVKHGMALFCILLALAIVGYIVYISA